MITTITKKWLKRKKACSSDLEMEEAEKMGDVKKIVKKLMRLDRFKDANWLISRILTKRKRQEYAVYAAELVLHIFEKKYPDDNRPRLAIESAKKCLKSPTKKNKNAAAAYAADAAAVDDAAAYAAAYAADAAAYAADAAYAAAAAYAADDAADADAIKTKIINYGIKLIYEN